MASSTRCAAGSRSDRDADLAEAALRCEVFEGGPGVRKLEGPIDCRHYSIHLYRPDHVFLIGPTADRDAADACGVRAYSAAATPRTTYASAPSVMLFPIMVESPEKADCQSACDNTTTLGAPTLSSWMTK